MQITYSVTDITEQGITLLDVQHIVLGKDWASVVLLAGSLSQGHEAVHLSSHCHCPVQMRFVLTQPLYELSADASLHTMRRFVSVLLVAFSAQGVTRFAEDNSVVGRV